MTPPSHRYSAADFLDLCRAALRASEQSPDPAAARRHARHAMRLALLGERRARLERTPKLRSQRTGVSSN